MRVQAAILCAGRGERFGADKVLETLGTKPVWKWSFDTFRSMPEIESVGLVCSPANFERIKAQAPEAAFVIEGGANRQESSRRAVETCEADAVLIHDGARPFVTPDIISRVIQAIQREGAAAAACPCVDTLRRRTENGLELLDREGVVAMQTPQGAKRSLLLAALGSTETVYTDEMGALEASGVPVTLASGSPNNIKITTIEDLARARAQIQMSETRTGFGYDVHRFDTDPERVLFLGGVEFDHRPGLQGHSDADVVLHAAVDALLGAASLGDIGQHFPPSDPQWKDRRSVHFLSHAAELLQQAGWTISNLDIAVVAEVPKIMNRSQEIRHGISEALGIECGRVSIKATTNEGLGSIGRGEGIAAFATATITR